MKILKISFLLFAVSLLFCCKTKNSEQKNNFPEQQLNLAEKQISLLLKDAMQANRIPRTINTEGKMHWTGLNFDWTEGFFPGTCWYLYEITKDDKWKKAAEKFQANFEDDKNRTANHDLGFVFNCSFGNGYRLTNSDTFKQVMITAGNSLITRFNPEVGCIKSWDTAAGWQAERGWEFPVIIDNMMNLELLFELTKLTGDSKYKDIAITHANTTLKHHFREDNSSYHVVDYNLKTGEVRSKQTAQGYADESSWARGQAWAVYGYTVCYRYTKDEKYLVQAQKIADYILNYKGLPADNIPYWDYNDPKIPNAHRDASAAAITVSALLELNTFTNGKYEVAAKNILKTLASEKYTAQLGENNHFIIKHSVGSIPHNNEIDVPLNYADYYYIEALIRYKNYNLKK